MRHIIFGESHGPAIGVTLEGVPAGLAVDLDFIQQELLRRATGKNALSTARKEPDQVQVLSGVFQGITTGDPLCMVIENTNQRSKDYSDIKDKARPGHADYTGYLASGGHNDYRGGGHFSGRLTAPLVAAGAVAKLILKQRGIQIAAHISQLAGIADEAPDLARPDMAALLAAGGKDFPVLSDQKGAEMQAAILAAREAQDSVGGVVQCFATGVPAGLGSPDFDRNAETAFCRQLFAVPAVKGVSFGAGFALAVMRGSQANDPFCLEDGAVRTVTNHNGGINGGITNGMPIVFSAVIKPTPSISQRQRTVDFRAMEETEIEIHGRHDPCIVHRAVSVIESAAALALCDLLGI